MAEYISSFITGFSDIVKKCIHTFLNDAKVIKVYDGLIHYSYNGSSEDINKVIIFNNSFRVIKKFEDINLNFVKMISSVTKGKNSYLGKNKGTFRVRFSKENQFVKVDREFVAKAEQDILRATHMKIDRVNPMVEYWYIIRTDGRGFYGELLTKRKFTEKDLNKGELRPEFAYLMCSCAKPNDSDIIIDPFAGYGSIPVQVIKYFKFAQIYISDINNELIINRKFSNNKKVHIQSANALDLTHIKDQSINKIITDPPWGFYEKIEDINDFYFNMLTEFRRILKPDGMIVLLSARKAEFEKAMKNFDLQIIKKIDTLVNGKKASVYICNRILKNRKTLQ